MSWPLWWLKKWILLVLCRKHWEAESGKKGDAFVVQSMIGTGEGTDHLWLKEQALVLYDTLFNKGVSLSSGADCLL